MKGWLPYLTLRRSPGAALAHVLLFFVGPAFFSGCTQDVFAPGENVPTEINFVLPPAEETKAGFGTEVISIDLFVYDAEGLQRLDSYQRLGPGAAAGRAVALSTSGAKRLVALANCPAEVLARGDFSALEDLRGLVMEYSEDDPARPLMSGETAFTAGQSGGCAVALAPLMSEIVIEEVAGTGGVAGLTVCLADLSGRCEVLRTEDFRPTEILPEGPAQPCTPGARLYCYPNSCAEDQLGAPATKIVVEGVRNGIPLRREAPVGGPDGIRRGSRYRLSLRLSDDPQTGSMTLYPGQFITGRDGQQIRVWVEVSPESTPVQFDLEDLEFDRERGIYDYRLDPDGKGVTLDLLQGGTGMFIVHAGPPVSEDLLVVIVVNP